MVKNADRRIARIWRGRTRAAVAQEYADYLYREGVEQMRARGAAEVTMLTRIEGGVAHFVVISYWPSQEAMTAWAGADVKRTHYLADDAGYLLDAANDLELLDVHEGVRP